MWQSIANIILRNKFIILGLITLLTVFFGYNAVTGLKLDNKHGILLPNNAQAKKDYDKFKELFGEDAGSLVVGIQTDSLYTETNFRKWKELGDSILTLNGVQSVISEANLFSLYNNREKKKFEARMVFSDTSYQEKSIDSIEREVKNNPVFDGVLYNDSSNVSLMIIAIDESYIADMKKSNVVMQIEKIANSYKDYFGAPKYAGMPHLRVVIGKQVVSEMYLFVALLIFMTSLLIWLFMRSLRVVFTCMLIVSIVVIWSMGIISLLDYHITIMMALIPPLMIVIGIPNCIFLFTKYHQEIKEHGQKALALTRVIRKIGTATFLTNLTTSLGFLTFVTTNSDKLMQFGISASINIMVVFVLSICILPITVSLSKTPKPRHLRHLERKLAVGLLDNLVNITVNHRRWVYVVTAVALILSVIGLFQISATGNITGDLPQGHRIVNDLEFVEENFGGTIPFEILIDYKEPSRRFKKSTLVAFEEIHNQFNNDTLFSKQLSYITLLKAANMAYHDNDSSQFRVVTSKRKLNALRDYVKNSLVTDSKGSGVTLSEVMDTSACILRIRTTMRDIGSYDISDKAESMKLEMDSILNPDKAKIEGFYTKYDQYGKTQYVDSILTSYNGVLNELAESYIESEDDRMEYNLDPYVFISSKYKSKDFKKNLRAAIDHEYFDITFTGVSIVASEGTKYLVLNLFTSLIFAILAIGILMAILFRSLRMVMISMVPNFIPLICTAGIMGWFGIPLKPSTLLVFSIAFGISIDDTIHYLAKYRLELKTKQWDLKQCIIMAIREAGLGMFYTSIILFCGFITFTFSQFGGTQALGLLISITLMIAMITNLVVLPTLLLSFEHRLTTKSFEEPFFDAYTEESNIDWENLDIQAEESDDEIPIEDINDDKE